MTRVPGSSSNARMAAKPTRPDAPATRTVLAMPSPPLGQQGVRGKRHDLGRGDHVRDLNVLVRLMSEVQDAGPVGDAVAQMPDAVDVLLVVGARRVDELGLAA